MCAKVREVGLGYAVLLAFFRVVPSRLLRFGRVVLLRLDTCADSNDANRTPVRHRWGSERDLTLLRAFGHTPETVRQRLGRGDRPFLAEEPGRLLGYAWFQRELFDEESLGLHFRMDPDEIWLYDAMVDGSQRGRGVYPRLLRAASQALAREDVKHIWIAVDTLNRNSILAHQRAGAREVHRFSVLRLLHVTLFLEGRPRGQPRISLASPPEFETRRLGAAAGEGQPSPA